MVSNFNLFVVLFSAITLLSCGPALKDTSNDENIIGSRLESVTSLKSSDGSQTANIAIFDETAKKIHQFDLDKMSCTRSITVQNPDEKHYVLQSDTGNYIVDLTTKHLSVIDKDSVQQTNLLKFWGKPMSASFRPESGYLVMYDDLKTVGILKLNSNGQIEKKHVFGYKVNGASISAGDVTENGKLVLALSDDSFVVADIEANLNNATDEISITGDPQPTTLSRIDWIAPVVTKPNIIFVKAAGKVVLYDLVLKQIIASTDIVSSEIIKLSKSTNPHIIERLTSSSIRVIYADGNSISTLVVQKQFGAILTSDLDIAKKTWTYVELPKYLGFSVFNDVNQVRESRQLIKYNLSGLPLSTSKIADNAQIKLGDDYFFALFPSELGYAEKVRIDGSGKSVLKLFNLKKY